MKQKIAIVYDWADKAGGVERLLIQLRKLYPEAPLYTSVYDKNRASWADGMKIHTSFLQWLPRIIRHNRLLTAPFMPCAFESFDLRSYDAVISVSSSFGKGIVTGPETCHISISLTPTRYLWVLQRDYASGIVRGIVQSFASNYLRKWDYIAAQRADIVLSISQHVAKRVQSIYGRTSRVLYPPFPLSYWDSITPCSIQEVASQLRPHSYYLVVSRIEPYKKIDLILDTMRHLPNAQCVVVGDGSRFLSVSRSSPSNVLFLRQVTDGQLAGLYHNAKATIMPQEEDFGYVALESLFFGTPVITYYRSGAAEVVKDRINGVHFEKQSVTEISNSLERINDIPYNGASNPEHFRSYVTSEFSGETFESTFTSLLKKG